MITKVKAEEILNILIGNANDRIQQTINGNLPHWNGFETWKQASLDCLEQIYGANHRNIIEFQQIRYSNPLPSTNGNQLVTFIVGLNIAKEKLSASLFSVMTYWGQEQKTTIYPTVFISCSEKAKKIGEKLKIFLTNLGAKAILVSDEPDLNLSVGKKVDYYMSQCDCGIAIITADEELKGGEMINKRNIDNEIGLMTKSKNINNRIIILKENLVKKASNYNEKVHKTFHRSLFSDIYSDLVKELRAFGFF